MIFSFIVLRGMLFYVIKYAWAPSMMTKYVHILHHVVHFLWVDATIAENIYSVVRISGGGEDRVGYLD